jgi:L-threonylcarbamoyladenylate synthase
MKVFHTGSLSRRDFDLILSVLRAGGVVGLPTDTNYGLAADPFNQRAVSQIFNIKGRPETKPILLLVDSLEMTEQITLPNVLFRKVARAFWPGPLTLVLPARPAVSEGVTAGSGTVGVRWPLAPFATELVHHFGGPLTATSANRSGKPACVTATEVQNQLGSTLSILVDGGELPSRGGSTLLDLTADPPTLLREGPVDFDTLHDFFEGHMRSAVK